MLERNDTDLIICSADSDTRKIREKINFFSVSNNIPFVFSGFSEYVGLIGPLVEPGKTPCWECIYKSFGNILDNLNKNRTVPSLGALCNIIGSVLGIELLKFLTNIESCNIRGAELAYDFIKEQFKITNWDRSSNCPVCSGI